MFGFGRDLAESFPKAFRSVLASDWLSSNRAWKNRPRGLWYTPTYSVVMIQYGSDGPTFGEHVLQLYIMQIIRLLSLIHI